jgi:hypothetical protein
VSHLRGLIYGVSEATSQGHAILDPMKGCPNQYSLLEEINPGGEHDPDSP